MNIYVGNLPWSIDDASLEQIFAEHGTSPLLKLSPIVKLIAPVGSVC